MHEGPFDPSESERVQLRAVVADIDRQLSCLARVAPAAEHGIAMAALTSSWATLVGLLALGVAPEVRPCPSCGSMAMRSATLCGSCWSRLTPVLAQQAAPLPS